MTLMKETASNPYRPPQAEVEDFRRPDTEPGPKPRQVFIAVVMLWVTLLAQAALQTCALVFLFLRPSREWFRGPPAA